MTNGMERLVASIQGTPSDRIPVFCNLLDQGAKELGLSLQEYYSNGEYTAEAQLKMLKKYGHDNVWSLFYVGKEAELLGCKKILFADDGPPNVEEYIIKTYDDIERLTIPDDLTSLPAFQEQLKCFSILKSEIGGRYPICSYITSTMSLPALLMGMEQWVDLLFTGPEAPRMRLLEKCFEFFVREVQACRQCGADIIVYSNPFASTDIVPMKFFATQSLHWLEKDIQAVGTHDIVFYAGTARMNDVLDTVFNRTGIGTYYLSPLDDIAEGKKIIAGRGLTCGIINDIKLIEWSKDEIRTEVRRMLNEGMPGGKFLFGTGVMPYCIPEENIRTMLDTVYEYGTLTP